MPLATDTEPLPQPMTDNVEPPSSGSPWAHLPKSIGSKDENDHPDTPRPELVAMRAFWRQGDILLGGTPALLDNADELIPPLGSDEESEERDARLRKLVGTPFYHDTIDRIVSKPFGRPVTFGGLGNDEGALPDGLAHLAENADGAGKSLTALLRDHLFEAVHRSGDCLLADLPDQEEARTQRDASKVRVVIKRISLRDILGWDYEVDGDRVKTTGLRLWEEQQRKVGVWRTEVVRGVRIIQAATPPMGDSPRQSGYSVFYWKNDDGEWILDEEGARPYLNERIYLESTWTNQISATCGKSPMTHLAELNVAYIMGDCEQQYGASYARVSTLWTSGGDGGKAAGSLGKDASEQLVVRRAPKRVTRGHRRHIKIPIEAQIGLLECTGAGLASGRAELDGLEKRMDRFGASHTDTTAGVTATSIRSDDARDTSNLRAWVGRVESTATRTMRNCAELLNSPDLLPAKFSVNLWRDWSEAQEREQAMAHAFSAWDRKLVPARVVHEGMRRFGSLRPDDRTDDLLREAREEYEETGDAEAAQALEDALVGAGAGAGAPKPDGEPDDQPSPQPDGDGE